MTACMLLANLEAPAFYRLSVLIFNESTPKRLFITPGYHLLHYGILLTFAAVGGSIGVLFSRWRKRTAFLFLLATLVVIAAFCTLGDYMNTHFWH